VLANEDIDSLVKAKKVLAITDADAIMISSVAHRRQWLFRELYHCLSSAKLLKESTIAQI
jgi:tRNA-dihydrouridine synthase B